MSPIGIGLDILLAGLLGVALVLGLRLNGRLKSLRDSHAAFGVAVAELHAAAARAEAGLKAIRAAADDTHDELLARIETARALAVRLEAATATAEKAANKAADLNALRSLPPEPAARLAKLVDLPPRAEPVRLRPHAFDDDLFEMPPARAAGRSAGR